MESLEFHYNHELNGMDHQTEEDSIPCLLDIYVHHASNIHNICIYADQDVYAKFSLTSNPDNTIETRVIAGGGKNPRFDERLPPLRVSRHLKNCVLKCEIWMRSCAKRFLEDQLLGFALVPLTSVASARGAQLRQEFALSSTDLFHSPAGTIQLSLSLDNQSSSGKAFAPPELSAESSISSEVVILEPPVDYGRIEFPDLNVVKENQEMVMQYFSMAAAKPAEHGTALLLLGASPDSMEDYEMSTSSNEEKSGSSDESKNNSGTLTGSTATALSDDRISSCKFMYKKVPIDSSSSNADEVGQMSGCTPETPTSKSGGVIAEAKDKAMEGAKDKDIGNAGNLGSVFKSPLGGINLEAEQSAMQQQIMDMYMKSMQQFTESVAKMKLPMDLDRTKNEEDGDAVQSQKDDKSDSENKKSKKDGSRVFYGSRAFF